MTLIPFTLCISFSRPLKPSATPSTAVALLLLLLESHVLGFISCSRVSPLNFRFSPPLSEMLKVMSPRHTSMEDLPDNVMFDILSRLPVKTIIHCKCVCKNWLNIVSDSYFADLHLSRSPAGLMIYHKAGFLKSVEFEDELNHHNLHHDPVMSLDFNQKLVANLRKSLTFSGGGSVYGLVCLWQQVSHGFDNICICNPITREYMILPRPQYSKEVSANITYSFGVSSLIQEHKVIRILQKHISPDLNSTSEVYLSQSEAEVYTLGTGQWRTLGHVPYLLDEPTGRFLNGHAHWTIYDRDSCEDICSFNFDNETFELFPSPPSEAATEESHIYIRSLGVLKGCLCRCDNYDSKLTVWVMKEYGIKKSWHKELVIQQSIRPYVDMMALQPAFAVVVFKDGTFLMATLGNNLIVYCPRRKAIIETEIFDGPFRFGFAYRPSFLRLQNFENESVHLF